MADAADSKSVARKGVWVQVPPPVLSFLHFPELILLTRLRAEGDAAAFAPEARDQRRDCEDDEGDEGHCARVGCAGGEDGLDVGDSACDEYAALVCEAGQEAAHGVGRKLRDVRGDDAPSALHHELQQERAREEQRERWRERPQRDDENRAGEGEYHRAPTPPAIR